MQRYSLFTDTNAANNTDAYGNADSHCYAHAIYSDAYAYSYTDTDTDPDSNANPYSCTHRDAEFNSISNPESYSYANTASHSDSYADPSNCLTL